MKVLLTGGSGFLGQAVLRELMDRNYEVVAIGRSRKAMDIVAALGATPLFGDLDDAASVDSAFANSGSDALVNVASLGFGHAQTIVAASEEASIMRAVFLSTTSIFTALANPSRSVRIEAEEIVAASDLKSTVIRPTMIYGAPGDRNMERLLTLVSRTPIVPLPGGGQRLIQPVHVDDLAQFVVTALESDATGESFNVAGPDPLSLRVVVRQTADAIGRHPRILTLPLWPALTAVRLYGKVAPNPRITVEQIQRLDEDKDFDISAARALGFTPRSFADGIAAEAALIT